MGPRGPEGLSLLTGSPGHISAGNSLSALLDGKATLTFLNRAEDYTLTMPYAHCKGEGSLCPGEQRPGRLPRCRRPGPYWSVEGALNSSVTSYLGVGLLLEDVFGP